MKITLEYYNHTCGDGCCDTYGYDVFVDGEKIGSIGEDAQELAELLNKTFKTNERMKQTAVEWLIGQLYAPCRGIPSHIIEQAKEMEKEQMIDFAFKYGDLTTREIADSFDKEYKTNEK